ncbi:MAG TPA: hypothetical protein VK537_03935, partial [Galbitalea sp.]|nr:hypothetical protein [Galbitalea sp.]
AHRCRSERSGQESFSSRTDDRAHLLTVTIHCAGLKGLTNSLDPFTLLATPLARHQFGLTPTASTQPLSLGGPTS